MAQQKTKSNTKKPAKPGSEKVPPKVVRAPVAKAAVAKAVVAKAAATKSAPVKAVVAKAGKTTSMAKKIVGAAVTIKKPPVPVKAAVVGGAVKPAHATPVKPTAPKVEMAPATLKKAVPAAKPATPKPVAPAKAAAPAKPVVPAKAAVAGKPVMAKPQAAAPVKPAVPPVAAPKPAVAPVGVRPASPFNRPAMPGQKPFMGGRPIVHGPIIAPPQSTPPAGDGPRKPVTARHGFKTNEMIVYPAHGVGRIVGIEEQEIANISLELFVIQFEKDKMILRVPTGKAQQVGMRKLAEDGIVKRAMETLKGKARIKRTMWSRRAQEFEAKINSGDLVSIAEVVRDLYRAENQPEQSYSERQLYEAALDRMARELAAVEKLDERGAAQRIVEVLSKSAKGRKAAAEGSSAAEADPDADEDAVKAA